MLSTSLRLWTTIVFVLAQFFSQHILCELPITQYCVVSVGYICISDMFQESKIETIDGSKLKCSRYRMQCFVSNAFLTTKQSLGFTLHKFLSDKGRPQASAAAPDLLYNIPLFTHKNGKEIWPKTWFCQILFKAQTWSTQHIQKQFGESWKDTLNFIWM